MATALFTVTRTIEVEKEIARVWEVFADFKNWEDWTKFGIATMSLSQKLTWLGAKPGPGEHIKVEFHSIKLVECVAQEWDPPRRLSVVACIPKGQRNYFDVNLIFTQLGPYQTRVDFQTSMDIPPLGILESVIPVRWLVATKIDSIIRRAVGML